MSNKEILKDQVCPFCGNKTLTLVEEQREIPYFGIAYLFSMDCSSCDYFKADIEFEKQQKKAKYKLDIDSEEDMKIRIIKSSNATIKIPRIITITPGPMSNGYITNVEGIINRVEKVLKDKLETEDDNSKKKKLKNMIKKLQKVKWGNEKLTLIIEDPTGNSAIISDKAIKS